MLVTARCAASVHAFPRYAIAVRPPAPGLTLGAA